MLDQITFAMMISTAIFIVLAKNLKHVIVAMGVFSILAAFSYLLYQAPDVAIAEAIIGSALSTLLYIVALKKYRTVYIYVTSGSRKLISDMELKREVQEILTEIFVYCEAHDLEVQCVYSREKPETIAKQHVYDLILMKKRNHVSIYGLETELHVKNIKEVIQSKLGDDIAEFYLYQEEEADETI